MHLFVIGLFRSIHAALMHSSWHEECKHVLPIGNAAANFHCFVCLFVVCWIGCIVASYSCKRKELLTWLIYIQQIFSLMMLMIVCVIIIQWWLWLLIIMARNWANKGGHALIILLSSLLQEWKWEEFGEVSSIHNTCKKVFFSIRGCLLITSAKIGGWLND